MGRSTAGSHSYGTAGATRAGGAASAGGGVMVSERCDPAEFVQAAVAWGRLRLDTELEQEIAAAELARDRWRMRLGDAVPGCHRYLAFLRQLRQWLQTGTFPRQGRRQTRELLAVLGGALVANGQIDPKVVEALRNT